jgi:hypothetical protein
LTSESTMIGYDEIIKKLWSIVDSKKTDDKEKNKVDYSSRTILSTKSGIDKIRTRTACKQTSYERIANLQYMTI